MRTIDEMSRHSVRVVSSCRTCLRADASSTFRRSTEYPIRHSGNARAAFRRSAMMVLVLTALQFPAFAQMKQVIDLSAKTKGWFEGYWKNLGGNEFPYFSFRTDVTDGLLTRCTDGKMTIEWETAALPAGWKGKEAGFLWIAAVNLTTQPGTFDVSVNGIKRFEIVASKRKDWVLTTADGGRLAFTTVQTDQYGDAHGYMSLVAPASWLRAGRGQIISITGQAQNQNTWIIVFRAGDALSYLHNSVAKDVWMEVDFEQTGDSLTGIVRAPATLAGETVSYLAGKEPGAVRLIRKSDHAAGEFVLPNSALHARFDMSDSRGEIFLLKSLGEDGRTTCLLTNSILVNESSDAGDVIRLTARRSYDPKLVSELDSLSSSYLADGEIYLMNSSHQDIAWMDSPEKCEIDRDTMLVTPLLNKVVQDTSYRFDLEESLILREYLSRHPSKKDLIGRMLLDGRISCGANFTQPYEDMYSGESLVRQMYFGAKWLEDEFGYHPEVYWSEDVPGRTPQMMQILRKAGVKYMMISRMQKGLYRWYSPDGSFVTMFSPGHYADAFTPLHKGFYAASGYLSGNSLYFKNFYSPSTKSPIMPVLSDWDMSQPQDYTRVINEWDKIGERRLDSGKIVPISLPRIEIADASRFFHDMLAAKPKLKVISGERPDVWVYIHGPSHEKALTASREGDILLTEAEKFATANALLDGTFRNYPAAQLRKAWEAKVYPDHGWGGKHGNITDDTFRRKFDYARSVGKRILGENLDEIASRVRTETGKGRPLVVFNGMNAERTDPVSVVVRFDDGRARDVRMYDDRGTEIACQLSDRTNYPDGSIRRAKIHFIAQNVPPIGYETFYMRPVQTNAAERIPPFTGEGQTKFYKLKFTNGGLASIYDRQLKVELINSHEFAAGEVFTLHSEGTGAGEFANIQQPDTAGFDRTGAYVTRWKIVNDGNVYTTYGYRQKIRYAVVDERIRVYKQLKRIDFNVALLNWQGVLYREFRMALPLNMRHGEVSYEVPFGAVTVGKGEIAGAAGERYTTPCSEVHPRGIQNWIGADGRRFGVTMSSSVAVADWIDPTGRSHSYPILQPILLASRRSCNPEGNEYLQTGDHYYHFSITSHKPGWLNGETFGRGANEGLIGVWADHRYANASLGESMSFFHTDSPNVLVSTVKKAEDRDAVVARIVDMEGKDRNVGFFSFKPIRDARKTNLIETVEGTLPVKKGRIQIGLGHNSIETFEFK